MKKKTSKTTIITKTTSELNNSNSKVNPNRSQSQLNNKIQSSNIILHTNSNSTLNSSIRTTQSNSTLVGNKKTTWKLLEGSDDEA